MRFVRVAVLLLAAMPVRARHSDTPMVELLVPPVQSIPMDLAFHRAQGLVTDIFSAIGVTVGWRLARPQTAGCSLEPMHRTILVALNSNTPAGFHSGALAISYPYATGGACVTVFMDRLRPWLEHSPTKAAYLLGHVLAHEIGHVLQGIARHSGTGVLKESWSLTEIDSMAHELLRFTPLDVEMILEGIRGRRGDTLAGGTEALEAR
jgi:hypothetical protein